MYFPWPSRYLSRRPCAFKLVAEQREYTWPSALDTTLPSEVRHIQRSRPLASENHTPEQARHRRWTGEHLTGKGILVAAAALALELEERTRWLARHGTITSDQVVNQGAGHELKSEVPLALGDPYDEGKAHIGLHSSFNRLPGRRKPVQHLGYLVIGLTGVDKATQEPFWTYASIGENMPDLAYPENVGFGYTPQSLYGPSLLNAFELRDMLIYAENHADAGLPQQPYPTHVQRG